MLVVSTTLFQFTQGRSRLHFPCSLTDRLQSLTKAQRAPGNNRNWLPVTVVALVVFYATMRVGFAMLRGLAQPIPEPPPPGELRKVKIMYRCSVCGAEVRMTIAPHEDPEPPRHCLEDMDLVAPIED